MPILCGERCLQGNKSNIYTSLTRAGFTGGIHHIRIYGVAESGFVFLQNPGIRFGGKLDLKGAVRSGAGGTLCNLFRGYNRQRSPPVVPAQPGRKANLPDNAIPDLRIIDCRSSVGHGRTTDLHFAVKHSRLRRSVHCDLKLGPLILLHIKITRPPWRIGTFNLNVHPAHETVTRSSEATFEGSIVICPVLGPGNLLVIGITKNHREVTIGDYLVIVFFLIDMIGHPLIANGLTGSVKAPVGKENRAFTWPVLIVILINVKKIFR